MLQVYGDGGSGLLNAPTGSGKTLAMWLPILADFIDRHPDDYQAQEKLGLQVLWITPLRALSRDTCAALQEVNEGLGMKWKIQLRTGDTSSRERQAQKKQMPEVLITTPESLHILFASKNYENWFRHLKAVVIDEWHELLGSKRAVQVELGLSRLKVIAGGLRIWGVSATIGNMQEAMDVLLGTDLSPQGKMVRYSADKEIVVKTLLPDEMDEFPWAGHLGIHMIDKLIPVLMQSQSTLVFTNTRSGAEIWYQAIIDYEPDLAGAVAMHHGSIDGEMRSWVEEALGRGQLKAVVCTSSLDLGIDFKPVQQVVQIGSPKGVSRFVQRAGRSGHNPGAVSTIYFLPTHAFEILEAVALKEATARDQLESREPVMMAFDVLVQYLVTLAVSDGFREAELLKEIRNTHCYSDITDDEWKEALIFVTKGGKTLRAYDQFSKVVVENNLFVVKDQHIARRHLFSIGTIVSEQMLKVKIQKGATLGTVEEYFAAKLRKGDSFWFAGKKLEFIRLQGFSVIVKLSRRKKGTVPRYGGGRMPLSSQLSALLREQMDSISRGEIAHRQIKEMMPILNKQKERSAFPAIDELLVEYIVSKEGHHLYFYPFEGRLVHEGLAAIVAFRISKIKKISFSLSMNDYGFELFSDQEIPIEKALKSPLFSDENLLDDLQESLNSTELARKKFRDIASIAGLIFQGYPGKEVRAKHLQASSGLIFDVYRQYDAGNLMLRQCYDEVFRNELEEVRMRNALRRMQKQKLKLVHCSNWTPLCFPIAVDRLRDRLSSESLLERIKRMTRS